MCVNAMAVGTKNFTVRQLLKESFDVSIARDILSNAHCLLGGVDVVEVKGCWVGVVPTPSTATDGLEPSEDPPPHGCGLLQLLSMSVEVTGDAAGALAHSLADLLVSHAELFASAVNSCA